MFSFYYIFIPQNQQNNGKSSPPIASISAELDLAANEVQHNTSSHKESNSTNVETLRQNDAVTARSIPHGDDDSITNQLSRSKISPNKVLYTQSPSKPSEVLSHSSPAPQKYHGYPNASSLNQFGYHPPYTHFPQGSIPSTHYGHSMSGQRLPVPPHMRADSGYNHHRSNQYEYPSPYYRQSVQHNPPSSESRVETKALDNNKDGASKQDSTSPGNKSNVDYDTAKAKTLLRSPPIKKRRVADTLDLKGRKEAELISMISPGNVFRSPRDDFAKQSPFLYGTDNISFGESFDMDDNSPNPKFDDIFPPSQSFEFGEHLPDDAKIMLTHSMSEDDIMLPPSTSRSDDQSKKIHHSPNIMFDSVLSPLRRSPQRQYPGSATRPSFSIPNDVFRHFEASPVMSGRISDTPKQTEKSVKPSAMDVKQATSGKKSSFPSPAAFHFQVSFFFILISLHWLTLISPITNRIISSFTLSKIGSRGGVKPTNIESINSAVNRQVLTVGNPNEDNKKPINETPMKTHALVVSTPSTSMKMGHYPGSIGRHFVPPMSVSRPNYISATPTSRNQHNDKENRSPQRRMPCNCKKSNCLKLYCVCFQSQLICEGCNCNDCNNTEAKNDLRMKAIKDTIAKNPNAFKPRFSSNKDGAESGCNTSPDHSHINGCKCKRSQCLKKYCECFDAGAMCSEKCKCIECQNYVGSQQLIDRRRKIKDHNGAAKAMSVSHDAWKNGLNNGMRNKNNMGAHNNVFPSPAAPHTLGQHPTLGMYPGMPIISPSPGSMQHTAMHPFIGRAHMMLGPVGFSPMGMQPVTPYSANSVKRQVAKESNVSQSASSQKKAAPVKGSPKTRAARKGFNPHAMKKKSGKVEIAESYFGPENAAQTKTTALAILSFLSNDDIYNASLVCHTWSKLCLDEELWQFEETS